jgi:poly(3-hydroxybutyrate) depolymerase
VRDGWNMGKDSPLLLKDLVDDVKTKYAIDPRRVYLFGHSAGAIHALKIGVLESEYFAAIAVTRGLSNLSSPLTFDARREKSRSQSGSGPTTASFRSRRPRDP